ncbi:MAG: hypothetical protein JW892_11285, partial [Anaerolineae bacterium]|nr:hypothetical protein [Anaerolineae bacterium]
PNSNSGDSLLRVDLPFPSSGLHLWVITNEIEKTGGFLAKEGAPHATMVEAFDIRLRQLYPEPSTTYSEGKKITPPGLKPDIFVEHPDGRKWAFEMVHGNQSAAHLLENHVRYRDAGICDHWILWDELEPKTSETSNFNQGVFPGLQEEQREYRLTAPQRAILEMQDGDERFIYAFTLDPFRRIEHEQTRFAQTMFIGVTVYCFEVWRDGQDSYPAKDFFVPMYQLEFAADGAFVLPSEEAYTAVWDQLAPVLGFSDTEGIIPTEALAKLERLPELFQTHSQAVMETLLRSYLEALLPEELHEIGEFFQKTKSGDLQPPPFSMPSMEEVMQAFENPEQIQKMAESASRAQAHLETLGFPEPLKRFFMTVVDPTLLQNVGDVMAWSEDSVALQQARKK